MESTVASFPLLPSLRSSKSPLEDTWTGEISRSEQSWVLEEEEESDSRARMNTAGRDQNLARISLSLIIPRILHGTHRKAWWLPSKSPNSRLGLRNPRVGGNIHNLQEKVLFFFYFYCFHFLFLFGVESRRVGRESKKGDREGTRRSRRGTHHGSHNGLVCRHTLALPGGQQWAWSLPFPRCLVLANS